MAIGFAGSLPQWRVLLVCGNKRTWFDGWLQQLQLSLGQLRLLLPRVITITGVSIGAEKRGFGIDGVDVLGLILLQIIVSVVLQNYDENGHWTKLSFKNILNILHYAATIQLGYQCGPGSIRWLASLPSTSVKLVGPCFEALLRLLSSHRYQTRSPFNSTRLTHVQERWSL